MCFSRWQGSSIEIYFVFLIWRWGIHFPTPPFYFPTPPPFYFPRPCRFSFNIPNTCAVCGCGWWFRVRSVKMPLLFVISVYAYNVIRMPLQTGLDLDRWQSKVSNYIRQTVFRGVRFGGFVNFCRCYIARSEYWTRGNLFVGAAKMKPLKCKLGSLPRKAKLYWLCSSKRRCIFDSRFSAEMFPPSCVRW